MPRKIIITIEDIEEDDFIDVVSTSLLEPTPEDQSDEIPPTVDHPNGPTDVVSLQPTIGFMPKKRKKKILTATPKKEEDKDNA